MTWWMIVLLIVGIFLLIGCIPLGVDVSYLGGVFTLRVKLGFLRLTLIPRKPKQKPASKPKKAKKTQTPDEKKLPAEKKKPFAFSGGVSEVMELLHLACDLLGELRRKLRMEQLLLHVRFGAGEDAARTAVSYGRAWAAIGAMLPCLERLFVIGKRDVGAELDWQAKEKMTVDARMVLSLTIGRALALALRAGVRFYKLIRNNKKAVLNNESSSE